MKSGGMTPLMARAAVPLTTGSGAGSWRGPPRDRRTELPCGPPSPRRASTPDGTPRFASPALDQIGRSASCHQAFHDVTAGTSTATFPGQTIARYQAGPGRDPGHRPGKPQHAGARPPLAPYASS